VDVVTFQGPATPLPAPPPRRVRVRRGLQLGGVISFIAASAVAVLAFVGANIGVQALVVGLVAAIIPVPVLVLVFLWLDRYEPEPVAYLVFCFTWGAFVATGLALAVNTGASKLFAQNGLPEELVAVAVAPFIEEIGKAAAPLLLLWRRRRRVSGATDGIVYCGLSAIGFAMVENILYLGGYGYRPGLEEYGPATGLQLLLGIFMVRILMSGFAHPLFTAAAGIGIGVAARSSSRATRWLAPAAGLLTAMLLHAAWNLMATLTETRYLLYGYVAVMVPIFVTGVGLALWLRSWEGRLTQRVLPDYVRAGWLSPPEVAALRSLGAQHGARRWAARVAGPAGVRAMRAFQFAAMRLALLRDRVQRGLDTTPAEASLSEAEERALLAEIAGHRQVFVGRDPQVPPARWDGQAYEILFPDGSARRVPAPAEPVVPVPVLLPPQR
jgi:RsiW-degrading membrane proteinase PrsW (M82 family)